jgi:hypothetical protein
MSAQPVHLLVFRDGARPVSGSAQKFALARQIRISQNIFQPEEVLRVLLLAGELECAVADSGIVAEHLERLTDSLAASLVNSHPALNQQNLLALLEAAPIPERLTISRPEGFAYYGLHPLAFADVLDQFAELPPRVVVVGIRSIGTTLSAVTVAGLRRRGHEAQRITVRPAGHPYNRHTEFSATQMEFVRQELALGASFLVVDEGPGLSGSSFLSVGEALLRAGVPREKITLLCNHPPQPERMCSENAAERCRQFRWIAATSQPRKPHDAQIWIGGGEWRRFFLRDDSLWPACWPSFERQKFLSGQAAEPRLYKFLGFGHYGGEILEREQRVAAAGFGLQTRAETDGFCSYPLLDGRPMGLADLSAGVLARLAAYCAFRLRAFSVTSVESGPLQQMAGHNIQELRFHLPLKLQLERPIIADGRMQPHEWLLTREGRMMKTDSGSHGDDHFFPGPTDIAWDLAGAIVEWQMNGAETETFLDMYRRASGDDARTRIADYLNAYAVFRCAYCIMAASAAQDPQERERLKTASTGYGARLMETACESKTSAMSMGGPQE